jgi:hypothetical protein
MATVNCQIRNGGLGNSSLAYFARGVNLDSVRDDAKAVALLPTDADYDALAAALMDLSAAASGRRELPPVSRTFTTSIPGFAAALIRRGELHILAEPAQDSPTQVLSQMADNIGELSAMLAAIDDDDAYAAQVSDVHIALGPDVSETWGLQVGLSRQELVESMQAARQEIAAFIDMARSQEIGLWVFCDRSAEEIKQIAIDWSNEHGRQAGARAPEFVDAARELLDSAFDN